MTSSTAGVPLSPADFTLLHRRHVDDKHQHFPEGEAKLQASFLFFLFLSFLGLFSRLIQTGHLTAVVELMLSVSV